MPQFIYTMKGLGKVHPPDHVVLKDIWLSFLPRREDRRARPQRRGQEHVCSSIMAGDDQSSSARRCPAEGISVGFLHQEPRLDPAKTVLGNVEEGVAAIRALLTRYDEINAKFGEELSPDEMEKVLDEQAQGAGHDRGRRRAGISIRGSSSRWTRCGCRRPTPTSRRSRAASAGASRSAGCCSSRPTCCCSTSRRTISTPSRSPGSSASCKDYPGTVVAVTHDRYFLDNVAGWILELDRGSGIPWEGNYSSWLEQKQKRLAVEEKTESKRQRTLQRELDWIRMSPRARQAKGKARLNAYEELLAEETRAEDRPGRDLHSAGSAARRHRRRGARPPQRLRRSRC